MCRGWTDAQTAHYKSLGLRNTGLRWMTQLLIKFWGVCWDLWQIRNEWEHKVIIEEEATAVRLEVAESIHGGFADLLHLGSMYSDHRLADLGTRSIPYLRGWLLNLKTSRKRAAQRALPDPVLRRMQALMHQYFTPKATS